MPGGDAAEQGLHKLAEEDDEDEEGDEAEYEDENREDILRDRANTRENGMDGRNEDEDRGEPSREGRETEEDEDAQRHRKAEHLAGGDGARKHYKQCCERSCKS